MLLTSHDPGAPPRVPIVAPACSPGLSDPRALVALHRPALPPTSQEFQAAVVLLAGPQVRFNIDLVSRRTGIARGSVAAFARRLVDNGAWSADGADVPWSGPADPRFWNDVAVAQGRLCRRRGDDGTVEWAPAGAWHKPYEYVDAAGPGLAVAYRSPDAPAEAAAPPAPNVEMTEETVPAAVRARIATALPHPAAPSCLEARARPAGTMPALAAAGAGAPSWAADLFPDACWLS